MLGQKTNANKFKRIEIIQNMFTNHYGIELEINKRKATGKKSLKTWQLNNTFKNNT